MKDPKYSFEQVRFHYNQHFEALIQAKRTGDANAAGKAEQECARLKEGITAYDKFRVKTAEAEIIERRYEKAYEQYLRAEAQKDDNAKATARKDCDFYTSLVGYSDKGRLDEVKGQVERKLRMLGIIEEGSAKG